MKISLFHHMSTNSKRSAFRNAFRVGRALSISLCVLMLIAGAGPAFAQTTSYLSESAFATATVAYATGASGTVLRSSDGGASWTNLNTGLGGSILAVGFRDASNGIV